MRRTPKRAVSSRRSVEPDLTALIGGGETKPKPGKKRWIFIGGGALLLCGAAVVLILSLSGSKKTSGEAVYREYTVERGNITVGQNESSSISLDRETVTYSVSTSVEEIYVKEGSSVTKGDPLMKLNADEIKIGLASYELQLEQAGLEVKQAKLDQQTKLLEAEQSYKNSVQDGKLASTTENLTVEQLQLKLSNAQTALETAQKDYEEYVALHASYPSDYAYLSRLEDRVDDYQDDVDELQNDLDDVNDLQDQIDALEQEYDLGKDVSQKKVVMDNAKAALQSAAENYIASGYSLSSTDSAYLDGEDIEVSGGGISVGNAETTYKAALSYYKSAKAAYDEAAESESGATDIATKIDELKADLTEALGSYSSVSTMTAALSSLKTKLSNAQTAYNDYKEDYNNTYGNIEDEDDLATKVDTLKAQVAADELALSQAGVNLTTGATTAEQQSQLAKNEASTASTTLELTKLQLQQAVDTAQEKYDTLNAEIVELKQNIAMDGVVVAPCTGMVAEINVDAGDSFDVTYNDNLGMLMTQNLCTLTNITDVYVPITISEEDILGVSIGQKATVTMNAFEGRTFDALVDTITVESSRSGAATVSYTVNVRLTGDNTQMMYEGMSADVTLVQRAANDVLYVSTQAITNVGGVATVLKKGEDGEPVKTEIKTGFSDGRYVEILSGLSEGDVVLAESAVGRS